jgi:ABC-type transport system involved in multi-copper enzyme maturation permease subunit
MIVIEPSTAPQRARRGGTTTPTELLHGVRIVLRAEVWRLLRSRTGWGLTLGVLLLSGARAYSSVLVTLAQRPSLSSGGAWACWADGWRVGLVLAALVLVAGGARSLAADLEQGLVRLALVRSASRSAVLLGRALLAPLCVLALWAASGLGSFFGAALGLDFGPLVDEGYTLLTSSEALADLRLAALAVLPALLASWVLGLTIGAISRSAAGAVAAALGLWLSFDLFKNTLFGRGAEWVFAAHVPTLLDTSPFRGLSELLRGFSDAPSTDATLRAALLVPLPQALLLLAIAWITLTRRRL